MGRKTKKTAKQILTPQDYLALQKITVCDDLKNPKKHIKGILAGNILTFFQRI